MSSDTASSRSYQLGRVCEDAPEKHLHGRNKTSANLSINLQNLPKQSANACPKVLWTRTPIFRQFLGVFLSKFCLNMETHLHLLLHLLWPLNEKQGCTTTSCIPTKGLMGSSTDLQGKGTVLQQMKS